MGAKVRRCGVSPWVKRGKSKGRMGAKARRCGAAPAVKWVNVRGGWVRKMRKCGVRVGRERYDAQLGLGRKWARRLGSRGGLFARGALFASSRLIDRYEYDDAARRNHE